MYIDTVLNKVPALIIIQAMEAAIKKGDEIRPITGDKLKALQEQTKMNGPLYRVGASEFYATAEELSWALRKGYVRSEFYGDTITYTHTEEFLKPRIRYTATRKGIETKKWY